MASAEWGGGGSRAPSGHLSESYKPCYRLPGISVGTLIIHVKKLVFSLLAGPAALHTWKGRMGGWRACPSSADGGVGSLEECVPPVLMLLDISSVLQAPEMSPEHTSGVLTPGRKISWVVSTLTALGHRPTRDMSMPRGPSCRTWTHLGYCDPISAWSGHISAQQAGSGVIFLLYSILPVKRSIFFPALLWGNIFLQTGLGLLAALPRCLSAKFPTISLLILHNSLGIDPPDFPTANLDSSACLHVSVDGSCFSTGT